ncbi:hypothetical protein OYC64_014938 [Pagothenia borchgrevinki]|uniref:Uncharacterized protein n=1 Tax=Pagothenia borchgrevinki TaxID=8213 RepID=A0ABD2H2A1_PAGBO
MSSGLTFISRHCSLVPKCFTFRTLSWRQPKRMLLPRKQDYVDIIGFEVIFHGDQIHCTPTTPTSRRLVIHCQPPDVN